MNTQDSGIELGKLIPTLGRTTYKTAFAIQAALDEEFGGQICYIERTKEGIILRMISARDERRAFAAAFICGFLARSKR